MLNGEYGRLSDYIGNGLTIINFWTTWWPFCERQLAYLDQLNSHFKDAGFKVLAVNANEPTILRLVKPYVNKRKYKFDVAVDPRFKLGDQFGVKGMPTQFLIAPDGSVISETSGFTDGDEEKYLKELIDYFDSENIKYDKNFQFVKQARNAASDNNTDINF